MSTLPFFLRKQLNAVTRTIRNGSAALGFLAAGAACVTVNVNFPESTVQKETDSYVRDLYRAKSGAPTKSESPTPSNRSSQHWEISFGIPSAFADENFRIDSPQARQIQERLRGRVTEILEFKRQGLLGETRSGLVNIHDPKKLKPLQAKKIEKLVTEENKDRNDLYSEVVTLNGSDKVQLELVKKSFMRSFQAESPSGTWVESADGSWSQKP